MRPLCPPEPTLASDPVGIRRQIDAGLVRRRHERIKTDRRDAINLAKLHRTGELTPVSGPDPAHEAIRDLVRTRQAAVRTLRQARQQLSGFLLRHGHHYHRPAWTLLHRRWLATLKFDQALHHIVLEDCIATIEAATARRDRLEAQIEAVLPEWSLAPVAQARLCCMDPFSGCGRPGGDTHREAHSTPWIHSAVPFKHHAEHRHHIPKPRYRVTNRAEYDAALKRRGSLTVWFTDEAVAAWRAEPRTTPGGQPHYSALAITTALTMRMVFGLALRQTEGLIGSVIGLLGLDLAVPDHSTLSRRGKTLEVPPLRRTGTGPLHLLVDSTGLKLGGAGEWLVEKHGTSRRRSWRKLHIGVDADSGEIVAIELTKKESRRRARWLPRCSTRSPIPSPPSPLTALTIRTGSTRQLPSVIRTLPSSCRRGQARLRVPRPRPLRHSATVTCG